MRARIAKLRACRHRHNLVTLTTGERIPWSRARPPATILGRLWALHRCRVRACTPTISHAVCWRDPCATASAPAPAPRSDPTRSLCDLVSAPPDLVDFFGECAARTLRPPRCLFARSRAPAGEWSQPVHLFSASDWPQSVRGSRPPFRDLRGIQALASQLQTHLVLREPCRLNAGVQLGLSRPVPVTSSWRVGAPYHSAEPIWSPFSVTRPLPHTPR